MLIKSWQSVYGMLFKPLALSVGLSQLSSSFSQLFSRRIRQNADGKRQTQGYKIHDVRPLGLRKALQQKLAGRRRVSRDPQVFPKNNTVYRKSSLCRLPGKGRDLPDQGRHSSMSKGSRNHSCLRFWYACVSRVRKAKRCKAKCSTMGGSSLLDLDDGCLVNILGRLDPLPHLFEVSAVCKVCCTAILASYGVLKPRKRELSEASALSNFFGPSVA